MELIDQHSKAIMEECKARARDAGLSFDDETLEYMVTNRDMNELQPKHMIPTLYDYWADDVETLKKKGQYKLYPHNPYETVINTRPAISFYNDNNPDWMNIMIFYHVVAHIDFFQNNEFFRHTWKDDFNGQALADKRLIANLRKEHGRWVDYAIEFSRGIDNLLGYFGRMSAYTDLKDKEPSPRVKYYFDTFLPTIRRVPEHQLFSEIERFNQLLEENADMGQAVFFSQVKERYPEFQAKYEKWLSEEKERPKDVMQYVRDHSPFLQKDANRWIKSVMNIVRNTSMYFQPQIRTKTINEGWASYWHDRLFRDDPRITGHESDYAKTNAKVTSISRVGLNPYAIGLRLIEHIEELADKGKMDYDFQEISDMETRNAYNKHTGKGLDTIFRLRETYSDFMLFNTFVSQDFVDKHKLFVTGRHLDPQRGVWQYYVKSRKAEDYKQMLIDSLYHPPHVFVSKDKTNEDNLYLVHSFEGKQLLEEFIPNVLIGLEYLWGGQVQLETTNIIVKKQRAPNAEPEKQYKDVIYTCKDRKVTKKEI